MKIYAIRDRLVDYFMTPFAAHEDEGVLNSIANLVSNEDSNDPVKQAPHHFEIWRIGEIDRQGHITPSREFLADCSSLVRAAPGAGRPGPRSRTGAIPEAPAGGLKPSRRPVEDAGAQERPTQGTPPAESSLRAQDDTGAHRTLVVGNS